MKKFLISKASELVTKNTAAWPFKTATEVLYYLGFDVAMPVKSFMGEPFPFVRVGTPVLGIDGTVAGKIRSYGFFVNADTCIVDTHVTVIDIAHTPDAIHAERRRIDFRFPLPCKYSGTKRDEYRFAAIGKDATREEYAEIRKEMAIIRDKFHEEREIDLFMFQSSLLLRTKSLYCYELKCQSPTGKTSTVPTINTRPSWPNCHRAPDDTTDYNIIQHHH